MWHPAPFSGFASFVPTGLDLSSSPYPELAPWALFFISLPLRSWVRGGAHEIGRPKQKSPRLAQRTREKWGTRTLLRYCFFRPYGTCAPCLSFTQRLRAGLHSCAASRLGLRWSLRDWEVEAKIPTSRAKNAREVGHPHPSPVLFRSSLRDLCPMSLVYPALTRWAAFLRRFAAGVAAERTRLGDRGKNPHVSRKERARSGAPAVGWTSRVLGRSQAPPGENGSARDDAALGLLFLFSRLGLMRAGFKVSGFAESGETTRLGDRGKNPHVSRKKRARSGAPGERMGHPQFIFLSKYPRAGRAYVEKKIRGCAVPVAESP